LKKLRERPPIHGEVRHLPRLHRVADVGLLRVDHGRFARYGYTLTHVADLQGKIDGEAVGNIEFDFVSLLLE
jgi:hypothetical protein